MVWKKMSIDTQRDRLFTLISDNKLDEAEKLCLQIFEEQNNAEMIYFMAVISSMKGDCKRAVQLFKKASNIFPERGDVAYNYGVELKKLGNVEKAKEQWKKAVILDPTIMAARYNLAHITAEEKDIPKAIELYEELVELCPSHKDAKFNLANIYYNENQTDKAIELYQELTDRHPDFIDAWSNLGKAFKRKKDIEKAEKTYRTALSRHPENVELHWNIAHTLLLKGQYKEGLAEYEWRLKRPEAPDFDWKKPLWNGKEAKDKTLVLWGDQGIGDNIQFLRFVEKASEKAKDIIVFCQPSLTTLVSNIKGVRQALSFEDNLPEFDIHAPLMSLPHIMKHYEPYSKAYIKAEKKYPLPETVNKKIGLVWSGNPDFPTNENRSCSPYDFLPLTELSDFDFYSLQAGETAKAIKNEAFSGKITDTSHLLTNFNVTASIIAALDVVITVDTAVAHLAGAMGKPVWIMLSAVENDWRWHLDSNKSEWYRSAELFRQKEHKEWKPVVLKIKDRLKNFSD